MLAVDAAVCRYLFSIFQMTLMLLIGQLMCTIGGIGAAIWCGFGIRSVFVVG
jgi:hypothetical protein